MKRKYELNLYAPFQYEDIQSHLEEMAERGWELEEARRDSEEGAPGPRGRMSLPWKLTTGLLAAAGVGTLALFVGIAVSDHGPLAAVRIAGAALEAEWQTFPALFGLAASSVLNAMYYIPAILAIWGRKRAGEEQPLVWDWSDKPGKGTLVVLLAGNVFLGTAFGPVWELLQQGIALF